MLNYSEVPYLFSRLKGSDVSFLRKQESRLCVCSLFLLSKWKLWNTFWIPACAGMRPLTRPTCRLAGLSPPRERRVASFG